MKARKFSKHRMSRRQRLNLATIGVDFAAGSRRGPRTTKSHWKRRQGRLLVRHEMELFALCLVHQFSKPRNVNYPKIPLFTAKQAQCDETA